MARGKVRAKVVLAVASVAFSLVAYNAFAIGDHYGKDHLTLTIEKIQPLKDGKIEIHYRTLVETAWWCPGANGKKTDAGTELTFVRASYKHKPKVTYPTKPGEKGAAIIVVPNDGQPIFRVAGEKRIKVYPGRATSDTIARLRFAPMWTPVPKFPRASDAEAALPVPSATYAMIWQPQWQEEIGISAEQKETLLAINAKAVAEARDHSAEFKKLSPEQRQAEVKSWAGKPSPWGQQLDNKAGLASRGSETSRTDIGNTVNRLGAWFRPRQFCARLPHACGSTSTRTPGTERQARGTVERRYRGICCAKGKGASRTIVREDTFS